VPSNALRQDFLLSLTDLLRAPDATNEILHRVSALLGQHFGVNRVGYGHVDERLDRIDYDVCWTDGSVPPLLGGFAASAFGQQVIDRLRAGETIAIANVREHGLTNDTAALRTSHEVDTRAILVVPLFKAGQLRTIVYLNQRDAREWTADEMATMGEVAERTRELIERGRAEQALRDSEARWRGLFERMQEGFFLAEALRDEAGRLHDFRFLEANPAFEALSGIPVDQAVGRRVREVVPDVPEEVIQIYARVMDTGEPAQFEAQVPSLGDRWYEARARRVSPTQFSVLFLEVTERRRAEAELRRSQARLRQLTDLAPTAVWFGEPNGSVSYLNPYWYQYTGQTEKDALPSGWFSAVHPEDAPRLQAAWDRARAEGSLYELEARMRRHDGVYRWFLNRAVPVRDDDGQITGWLGNSTDIDDRKRAEVQLAELNAQLEARINEALAERRVWAEIAESSDAFIAAVDTNYRFLAVNRTFIGEFERLFGRTPKLGASMIDLLVDHPEVVDVSKELWGRAMAGERFSVVDPIGGGPYKGRHYETRFNPLRDAKGQVVGAFQYAVDVTQHMEDQRRLRQAEDALRQSQKMEAIGQLTGGVAHDFNNLLQVISANLQLLGRYVAGNERAEQRVQNALNGVSRGAKLAAQLLAFGRRQPLEPRVINVARFIQGMDDMLRRALGEEVEVETVIAGGIWNTLVDPSQVENAILNLAINARDAMAGAGKLTIEAGNAMLDDQYARVHDDVKPGQYVMIAVSDNGSGMPPDVIARAFEPFFSTKPEGKGTGLGLSMVYGFVKQSGGHVKIYSELGEGTTVKLYLPRAQEPEETLPDHSRLPVRGGDETILVVEDDEDVRETAVALLSELGYRVLKAKDGASAMSIVESGLEIDLLFTDVVMPGPLRSPDLARRAKDRLPDLAVLFTSGYTENAIVHGGRLDAGVELLAKPYTREALARKVRHVLGNRAQQRLARATDQAKAEAKRLQLEEDAEPLAVLLAEDDELIRSSTAEILRELGHTVYEAQDNQQALDLLERARPQLLLLDVSLPDGSGVDLARLALAKRPDLAVVFATGHAGVMCDGELANACCLPKPYTPQDLVRVLTLAVDKARPLPAA